MSADNSHDAALYLTDIHNFFEAPELDPFLGDSIDESGIDQLMDTMKARPRGAPVIRRIVLHLPADQIGPGTREKMLRAIAIYSDAQSRLSRQKIRETRIEGRRALRVGFIVWAICLALSMLSEQVFATYNLQGRLLGEGFLIAGWVSLWRPAELLLYDWWPYSRDIRLYKQIKAMDLVVVPREPVAEPPPA